MFSLSTCGWCKRTKRLLDELGVDYQAVDVDLLPGTQRERALEEMKKWNPEGTFPTLVVDGKEVIVGYRVDKIKRIPTRG